ncbi:hypothetical protein OGR47_10400 [Methylocystis sp. MJC1]|uniref:hypothetical protein n=1 Tax=Methylocystis sp. MJC1 TaxID=2654282 RepID=UPI0013EB3A5C|nr:hypothetical protein [Methylocystis sp. MJC1]KAF2992255.1 hypothetical protein MJC1_00633 [Methylocystis sp. MJC1]MBU6527395.1 hypothetical protein [Methylocystis sp. MJC1]UZX10345.1 hypothetical protein OGR47_10400 [Methylocystis sp. MJC1]
MNRIETTREIASRKFASRPVRVAVAVKIAFAILGANVSFAAAKAYFHTPAAPAVAASVSAVEPFILPVEEKAEVRPEAASQPVALASASTCREVVTQTDEGYGVRGSVTRIVCRKAL